MIASKTWWVKVNGVWVLLTFKRPVTATVARRRRKIPLTHLGDEMVPGK